MTRPTKPKIALHYREDEVATARAMRDFLQEHFGRPVDLVLDVSNLGDPKWGR